MGVSDIFLPGYTNPETGELEWQHPTVDEVNEMETLFLGKAVTLWITSKRWGLPHGKGWLDEKATVVDIINVLESENNRYESWEIKNRDHLPSED